MKSRPFPGLIPYTLDDADFFFGRDSECQLIIANLIASRLTILYGASGVGKTSLLHAGVLHSLREQQEEERAFVGRPESLTVVLGAWKDDPVATLVRRVREALEEIGLDSSVSSQEGLLGAFRDWTRRLEGRIFVILDQFEEFFLYHASSREPDHFESELPRLIRDPDLDVHFLVVIREDALAKLDRFKGKIPSLFDNYIRLRHLSPESARDAIEQPIEQYNLVHSEAAGEISIESELVEALLEQLAEGPVAFDGLLGPKPSSDEDREIEAPYLQVAMARIWDEERASDSRTLRHETLTRLGGAVWIVRTHLETVLAGFDAEEQLILARAFRHLITPGGSKIAHTVPDLAHFAEVSERELGPLLARLCENEYRILRPLAPPPTQPSLERYEIFHDVLSEAVLDWLPRFFATLEQRQSSAKRKRVFSSLFEQSAWALLIGSLVLFLAYWFSSFREDDQLREQEARRLAALALTRLQDGRPDQALLLGVEASLSREEDESRSALLTTLDALADVDQFLHGAQGPFLDVAFAPGARALLAIDGTRSLSAWPLSPRGQRQRYSEGAGSLISVATSPVGSALAAGSSDGSIWLGDRSDPSKPLTQRVWLGSAGASSLSFNVDGSLLAAGSPGEGASVWVVGKTGIQWLGIGARVEGAMSSLFGTLLSAFVDSDSSELGFRIGYSEPELSSQVAFHPQHPWLFFGESDGEVQKIDLLAAEGNRWSTGSEEITSLAIDPMGRRLATGSSRGVVQIWDPERGLSLGASMLADPTGITALAFSRSGVLATGGGNGKIQFWSLATHAPARPPIEVGGPIYDLAFSKDGWLLVAGTAEGPLPIWRPLTMLDLPELPGEPGDSASVTAFHPGSQLFARGASDGTFVFWNAETREPIGPLRSLRQVAISALTFDASGEQLAIGYEDGSIDGVEVESAQPSSRIERTSSPPITSLAFSEGLLAAGDSEGTIELWDRHTGSAIGEAWVGHNGSISRLRFSPDGSALGSASEDGTLRTWDVETQQALESSAALYFDDWVWEQDEEGRFLQRGIDDPGARLEDLPAAFLRARACRKANRSLDESEWAQFASPAAEYRKSCQSLLGGT